MNMLSNAPKTLDIVHRQRSKQVFDVTVTDSNDAIVDITGRRYILIVTRHLLGNKADRILTLDTLTGGLDILNGIDGKITVTLDDFDEPAQLPIGTWHYLLDRVVLSPLNLEPTFAGTLTVLGRS